VEKHKTVEITDLQKYDFSARAIKRSPIAHANMIILKKIDQRETYLEFICEYIMRRNDPYFDDRWAEMDIQAKKLVEEAK